MHEISPKSIWNEAAQFRSLFVKMKGCDSRANITHVTEGHPVIPKPCEVKEELRTTASFLAWVLLSSEIQQVRFGWQGNGQ